MAWLITLFAALTVLACNPGQYPIDIFREMHYQQSQRILEPDRLAPPADAVPRTGARTPLTFAEARAIQNPIRSNPETLQAAAETFRINCAVCHGQDGRGQSFVAQRFAEAGLVPPADLSGTRVRSRSDGELYWIVTYGLGNMPPFRDLLTDQQIWMLVHRVREVQGQR